MELEKTLQGLGNQMLLRRARALTPDVPVQAYARISASASVVTRPDTGDMQHGNLLQAVLQQKLVVECPSQQSRQGGCSIFTAIDTSSEVSTQHEAPLCTQHKSSQDLPRSKLWRKQDEVDIVEFLYPHPQISCNLFLVEVPERGESESPPVQLQRHPRCVP